MILYLNSHGSVWQHKLKLAGIARFAATREWRVVTVPPERSRPEDLAATLSRLRPDGCIVELSIPNPEGDLTPRRFALSPRGRSGRSWRDARPPRRARPPRNS